MRDALISGDYPAAVRMLQEHFRLGFSINHLDYQPPSTWGIEWGIEIIAGKPWNMCYSWFETDGFIGCTLNAYGRPGGDTQPTTVRIIIWEKL